MKTEFWFLNQNKVWFIFWTFLFAYFQPVFSRLLSIEEIDLELSDGMRAEIKRMIRENVDV